MAPLLAERVTHVEAALMAGEFAEQPLDEAMLQELHRRICGDLVPEWAGKWRDFEVRVGTLHPPLPFQLPMLMREYALDLQARWPAAAVEMSELTLELLSFAEGRFLTVHPFRDFNGRTIRLFLVELLRRLDLPVVDLAPEDDEQRADYFRALEAADAMDWQPLAKGACLRAASCRMASASSRCRPAAGTCTTPSTMRCPERAGAVGR